MMLTNATITITQKRTTRICFALEVTEIVVIDKDCGDIIEEASSRGMLTFSFVSLNKT